MTLHAAGQTGLGWTYSSSAAAHVIQDHLANIVGGRDAMNVDAGWEALHRACRNLGTLGLVVDFGRVGQSGRDVRTRESQG